MTSDDPHRRFVSFPITDFQKTKRQMLNWATQFGIFCFLDNQGYPARIGPGFECLLAAGASDQCEVAVGAAFARLKAWAAERRDWLFGYFAYDLAAETEPGSVRSAQKSDPIGFPDLFFFIPEVLIELAPTVLRIGSTRGDQEAIWRQIATMGDHGGDRTGGDGGDRTGDQGAPGNGSIPPFTPRLAPSEYLERVADLQRHILRGDCYEINFCQEFYSRPADLDPLAAWGSLSRASPNPFSCFFRLADHYLLCASPERYLKKTGGRLYSQPIKGTSVRYPDRPDVDSRSARDLLQSAKDRAENVMVVDLVRNDLSKICIPGSVRAEELFGIYPFPQVFQMISTITGNIVPGLDWTDAIRETFPMGSMTGAPKHRVIRLIDQYERSRRGVYSGAVGYVTPERDFDFNVVIRSLLYNRKDRYLSYQVGSGITFYSDPEAEYQECLIKAAGILKALGVP